MDDLLKYDILFAIIFLIYPGILIAIAKQLEKIGCSKDFTRKFVHSSMGLVIFFVPFFHYKLMALLPPALFILINAIDYRYGILSQIQGEDKGNIGTVLYPVSYFILIAVLFNTNFWGLAVLGIATMAIGDAAASLIGRYYGVTKYTVGDETRSYAGTISMFFLTFIIAGAVLGVYGPGMGLGMGFMSLMVTSLIIAGVATIVEALSVKGSDNLTVPILTALTAFILISQFAPNVLGNQSIVEQPLF